MNSLTKHLTPKILYAQLKMERQKHKGVFFLIEGSTDFKRFEKFIDSSVVSIVTCGGKSNVIGALEISQDVGFEDCLGFVDLDFDAIENCVVSNDDVIYSCSHDFDLDICQTDVFRRYLQETADNSKLTAEGGYESLFASLLDALRPLSAMRYANVKKKLRYNLSNLRIHTFFDGVNIDVDAMVNEASGKKFSGQEFRDSLKEHIQHYAAQDFDLAQFTCGHDLIGAVGIALQSRVGTRQIPQTLKQEVERHLRLAFDHSDFHACGLAPKIVAWDESRKQLSLLKKVA